MPRPRIHDLIVIGVVLLALGGRLILATVTTVSPTVTALFWAAAVAALAYGFADKLLRHEAAGLAAAKQSPGEAFSATAATLGIVAVVFGASATEFHTVLSRVDSGAELELSRAISQLTQQCGQEQKTIDESRMAALIALPGAKVVVDQYWREIDDAQAARDAAVQKAKDDRVKKVQGSGDARSEEHRKAEAEWRQADAKADNDRRAAAANALVDYRNRLKEIEKLASSEQSGPRRDAEAAYKRALENVDRDYKQAVQRNRDAMQARREKALAQELADGEQAGTDEDRATKAAVSAQQAAKDRAETRMRRTLETLAGAAPIVADFDSRTAAKKQDCGNRMDALFQEYHKKVTDGPR